MIYRPDLKETLPIWDEQLLEYGRRIIRRRKTFIDELNEIVYELHRNISGSKETLILKYEPNIDDAFFQDELNRAKEKDLRYCQTSVGPHRDDMLFDVSGIDIRKYGPTLSLSIVYTSRQL